ncbi:MAG: hypothetical protein LBG50_04930 [Clostridiales Family XIII bacterium]|jgi:hypothetical protein|nr:hypothetical protein [Clostridiales Family XIII bacterium]
MMKISKFQIVCLCGFSLVAFAAINSLLDLCAERIFTVVASIFFAVMMVLDIARYHKKKDVKFFRAIKFDAVWLFVAIALGALHFFW